MTNKIECEVHVCESKELELSIAEELKMETKDEVADLEKFNEVIKKE